MSDNFCSTPLPISRKLQKNKVLSAKRVARDLFESSSQIFSDAEKSSNPPSAVSTPLLSPLEVSCSSDNFTIVSSVNETASQVSESNNSIVVNRGTKNDTHCAMAGAPVKLNDFSPLNPSLWFLTAETIFDAHDVKSEKERFAYLIQMLSMEQAENIQTIIESTRLTDENLQEKNPYTAAKEALLKHYGDSEEKKLRKLFDNTPISHNQRPSEILTIIRRHGSTAVTEQAVKELWWSKLTDEVKAYLTGCRNLPLSELAEHADSIQKLVQQRAPQQPAQINAIDHALLVSALHSIQADIAALKIDQARSRESRPRDTSRGRGSRSRRRSPNSRDLSHSRHRSTDSRDSSVSPPPRRRRSYSRPRSERSRPRAKVVLYDGLCWYHFTFGDEAEKCRPTCAKYDKNLDDSEN